MQTRNEPVRAREPFMEMQWKIGNVQIDKMCIRDSSCPDPDWRCGTDFPGQYYFYKSEKENIAEKPACYPGVL